MNIQTVAILGAGAVGSYFIDGLYEKLGNDLWIIAEGERKERLTRDGIIINGKTRKLHVKSPEEACGADFLMVCVKYGALRASLPAIKKAAAPHTIVMSPMNGVDSEEIISEVIDPKQIVYSMMKIAAERDGNSVVYNPAITQGLFYGDLQKDNTNPQIKAIEDLFRDTPVRASICADIIQDIWYKYALNISKNLPQAFIGCGYGAYGTSEHLAFLSDKLADEVIAVAAAKGIDISDKSVITGQNGGVSPKARFSTLQDLEAKRRTEIDMFSGTILRMGKELGIETPYNAFTYHTIKALEEKNEGIIA